MATDPWVSLILSSGPIANRYDQLEAVDPREPGAFSLVFKARDRSNGGTAILKFLHPHSGQRDPYRRQCFVREAELLKRFQGKPNVVELIAEPAQHELLLQSQATGQEVPVPLSFFVTECADGDLNDYIYGGRPRNVRDTLELIREVCKGVQRMHAEGIAHRDLKPGNCFLFGKEVKLGDFGTARDFSDTSIIASYLQPVGDMRFASPEIMAGLGDRDEVWFDADIFALGCILFQSLTRDPLFNMFYNRGILALLEACSQHPTLALREQAYASIESHLASEIRIPTTGAYSGVPRSLRTELDGFIKRLCTVRPGLRPTKDFSWIFRRIQICLAILDYEAAQANRKQRRRWRRKKL